MVVLEVRLSERIYGSFTQIRVQRTMRAIQHYCMIKAYR